jgi:citrate lyase subunit beta/citryl-CoA lyase
MPLKDRLRRNMVIIPGNVMEDIKSVLNDPETDSVILDLEDLVSFDHKLEARAMVCDIIKSGAFQAKEIEVVVRINHPDSLYFEDDVRDLMSVKPDILRVPKVESREDVLLVDKVMGMYEKKNGYAINSVYIMAAIESARGVLNAYEIASASPRLIGIALSAGDYCKDLKVIRTKEGNELDWARGMLLNSGRAAGVFVMDTSFTFSDLNALEKEAKRAKDMGFDGKTTLGGTKNPEMAKIINKVFSPSPEEIEYAKKVLAIEGHYEALGGASNIDGDVFIDKPIVEQYRRLLRIAGELKN